MEESGKGLGTGLVSTAVHNPHLIIVGCLIVVLMGILAIFNLPKDLLPSANLPAMQVISSYPGMPVTDVEENLTARFERNTAQAIGMERQESKSLVGVSIIKNFFNTGAGLNSAMAQTTSLVMSVMSQLPPGTLPPLILPFDPMASVPLALVAVRGKQSIEKIYDVARYDVRNTIQAVPGAMAPTVMGGRMREIVLYLDPKKLDEYNFSPLSVLDIVVGLNSFIPSGDVKIGNFDYQITSNGLVEHISEMNDFPLRAEYGVPVYLKQIGEAKDSGQIQTNIVLIDGKEQVYVPVYRQPGGNSIQTTGPIQINHVNFKRVTDIYLDAQGRDVGGLSQDVQKLIDKTTLPEGYSITIRGEIREMNDSVKSLGGGFLLAATLVYLILVVQFRSFSLPLVIMVTVPLGIVGIVLMLVTTHTYFSIQAAIGAIFMIGIAVANGVLLIEFISYHTKLNDDLDSGIVAGAKERLRPILMTSLAAILGLIPMAIGIEKGSEANIPLGRAVIGGQLFSVMLTLFVVPILYRMFFAKAHKKARGQHHEQ